MTASLTPWLALRYPFDDAARSDHAVGPVTGLYPRTEPLNVLDLGAGTAANFRYLAPRIGGDQQWLLVDQSAELLAAGQAAIRRMAAHRSWRFEARGDTSLVLSGAHTWAVRTKVLDMAGDMATVDVGAFDLVTASALTDLVSFHWFQRLIQASWDARALVAIALTYDGRTTWQPSLADDATMLAWFNRHQRTDKGFGPAMGPDATEQMTKAARAAGYSVISDASDWHIGPGDVEMHNAMIEWVTLANEELMPDETDRIRTWAAARRRLAAAGACTLTVGHFDILAFPPDGGA